MVNRIKFSFILTGVLALSAFIPILNSLIMTLNGAILFPISDMNWAAHIWVNLILAVVMILFFYRSKKQLGSILFGLLTVLFLLPYFLYSFENVFSDNGPYFIQFLIGGFLTGGTLMLVEYFKKK